MICLRMFYHVLITEYYRRQIAEGFVLDTSLFQNDRILCVKISA